jgi:membrane peptidoglycan carboxypeptidase
MAFDLRVALPPTACRQVLGAVPEPLRRPLDGVGLEGRIGFEVHLALDAVSPDATVLDGVLDNRCKISDFGSLPAPDDFRRLFAWMAYDDKGNRIRMLSGPGSDHWTAIGAISPYLSDAVLTTEDGKFESHQGLTLPELRTALAMNLRKGALDHGASTITMQLAKNLFLSRDRTVARKLQELFFTWYLESNFTKDEILELYFNVVEFGPSIYGVGPAARYYFGREPFELNLVESVFLVKLLPSPVARHNALKKEGGVSRKKMASLHRVMQVMFDRRRIFDAEYRLGLEQELVFYEEGDPLPEPRLVTRRDGVVDLSLPPGAAEDTFAEEFDDWE